MKRFLIAFLLTTVACGEVKSQGSKKTSKPKPVNTDNNGSKVPDPTPNNKTPEPEEEPAIKNLPGIDLSVLPESRRKAYLATANDEISPCDRPETLAACVVNKSCLECGYAAKALLRRTRDDPSEPSSTTLSGFLADFKEELTKPPVAMSSFDLTGVPSMGKGPIIIVEFADFQCPHCAELHHQLNNFLPGVSDKVTFYYKNFPLPSHDFAEPAARASLAAGKQGKFWEMHHKIFDNQDKITKDSFEVWAKELGLDPAKFKADFESPELANQVARDRKEGETLQLNGTPSMFINGRLFTDSLTLEALQDAVEFAAAKQAAAPTPAPAPAPAPTPAPAPAGAPAEAPKPAK